MFNTKIYSYPTGDQLRFYSHNLLSSEDHEDIKDRIRQKRLLEWQLMEEHGSSLSDWMSLDDYLNLTDFQALKLQPDALAEHYKLTSENRSKKKIYEYARANTWEYFITLTFDREKVDSSNYSELVKKVGKWFNNVKSRKANSLKYLIVPELHKDGIHYHFHGLLSDCGSISFVPSGHYTKDGQMIYNMPDFKYGFTTATKVNDTERVSYYITKYITKELEDHIKGKKRYIISQNLKLPKIETLKLSETEKQLLICNYSEILYTKSISGYISTQFIECKK